jgi:hypothetical protein
MNLLAKLYLTEKTPIMTTSLATTDLIATKILFVREEKVLLDFDLALLYRVETDLRNQYEET